MKNDYDRSLVLLCPICVASDFSFDEAESNEVRIYNCNSCGMSFSHQTLLTSNSERVSAAVDELKNEILSDVSKGLKDAFKGVKGWTVR